MQSEIVGTLGGSIRRNALRASGKYTDRSVGLLPKKLPPGGRVADPSSRGPPPLGTEQTRVAPEEAMAYTRVYATKIREEHMLRKAKIFMNNRSQAVRLPKEFQFRTQEVFIRKEGSEVVLSPRPFDWTSYLADGPVASADFMEGVQDLPVQEREP